MDRRERVVDLKTLLRYKGSISGADDAGSKYHMLALMLLLSLLLTAQNLIQAPSPSMSISVSVSMSETAKREISMIRRLIFGTRFGMYC